MIDFRFYLVTDRRLTGNVPLAQVVETACSFGVRAVQVREKDLGGRELYELATSLRRITDLARVKLLVNDRVDIALATRADGVHCPASGFPVPAARRLLLRKIIGASTHSLESALEAERRGADFITFGPVFATPSKASYGNPQGLDALAAVTHRVSIPVFALGGVTPERAKACVDCGAAGVSAVSVVMAARDISKTLGEFEKALGGL